MKVDLNKPVEDVVALPEGGVIDTHCHGRDKNEIHKTTIEQVLTEARDSLVGTSVFMPNTDPPLITYDAVLDYLHLIETAREKLGIKRKQHVFFGATDYNHDEAEKALKLEEVVGEKFYPGKKDGGTVTTGKAGISDEVCIRKHLCIIRQVGKVGAFHCDDPWIIEEDRANTIRAEVEGVTKAIEAAEDVPGVKITICHPSCAASVMLAKNARRIGMAVFDEQAIHYHFFDNQRENRNPNLDPVFYHCFNNLRGSGDRQSLNRSLLSAGAFTGIASDSACHETREKLEKKLGGIPSNQQLVPGTITSAKKLGLTNQTVLNLIYYNPARYYGIPADDKLVLWRLEEREDNAVYNHGKVTNSWKGLKLWFPVERIK